MRWHAVLVVATAFLLAADTPDEGAVKKDLKKLEGTWKVVGFEHDGKKSGEEELKDWKIVIAGDKYTMMVGNITEEGTFKIVPGKKPKWVDTTPSEGANKGQTRRGIYELKDDDAKMCIASIGKEERPKEFAAQAGDDNYVWIFKREKP
jgi:uncharacterized protein (TIGR03067 family)